MVAASNQSGFILFKEAIFELPVVYKSEVECVEALMRGTGSKTPVRLSVSLREGVDGRRLRPRSFLKRSGFSSYV
jgi:hypothetical protein